MTMTKTSDKSRKWMWWFLAVGVALQMYFVRELLAAFALFAAGFAVIGFGRCGPVHDAKDLGGWSGAVRRQPEPGGLLGAQRPLRPWKNWAASPFRRPV